MRLGKLSYLALASLAAAPLAFGCASSGGEDEVQATVSETDFVEESSMPVANPDGERGLLETVYFDFDSAALRSDTRTKLQDNVRKIQPSWQMITIEGHCDERGSEEYNLALGERRANAAKQYMIDSGVPAAKLDTVSFGESKPAVQGHDEAAWKWNRRDEFVVRR
jgi:peptidoglycan-associated lipoprotein